MIRREKQRARARTPTGPMIGTRPPSRWGNACKKHHTGPAVKPVTQASRLAAQIAPSVESGLGSRILAAGPAIHDSTPTADRYPKPNLEARRRRSPTARVHCNRERADPPRWPQPDGLQPPSAQPTRRSDQPTEGPTPTSDSRAAAVRPRRPLQTNEIPRPRRHRTARLQ